MDGIERYEHTSDGALVLISTDPYLGANSHIGQHIERNGRKYEIVGILFDPDGTELILEPAD